MVKLPTFQNPRRIGVYIDKRIPRGDFSIYDISAIKPIMQAMKKGELYVEIGVRFGKSFAVAAILAPEIRLVGVDKEDPKGRIRFFRKMGLDKRDVRYIHADSSLTGFQWKEPINVLHIDGDHSYHGVENDILAWIPHVVPGGWVFFHDYTTSSLGVIQAVEKYLLNSDAFDSFFTAQVTRGLKSSVAGIRKK